VAGRGFGRQCQHALAQAHEHIILVTEEAECPLHVQRRGVTPLGAHGQSQEWALQWGPRDKVRGLLV
jgi:hypothetical protein